MAGHGRRSTSVTELECLPLFDNQFLKRRSADQVPSTCRRFDTDAIEFFDLAKSPNRSWIAGERPHPQKAPTLPLRSERNRLCPALAGRVRMCPRLGRPCGDDTAQQRVLPLDYPLGVG